MKKILFYFCFVIILIFTMPIVFTNKFETKEVVSTNPVEEDLSSGDIKMIKLLHTESGNIEILDLDSYLIGVVASEMPASFEKEALKAQAIVARTYTFYQIKNERKHENADICDSPFCCQAWISKENRFARWEDEKEEEYWNKISKAVLETKDKIIKYNNEPIKAFFHSNSGGKTELAINVWGGDLPYLQCIETNGEDAYTSYNSILEVSKDDFIKKMLEQYSEFKIDFQKDDCIKILEYTEGERVQNVKIGNKNLSGIECRKIFELKSAKFDIEVLENSIKFFVTGYGHGVGLSQCGSDFLAKQGKKYEEIIKYYYKDIVISE